MHGAGVLVAVALLLEVRARVAAVAHGGGDGAAALLRAGALVQVVQAENADTVQCVAQLCWLQLRLSL